MVDKSQLPTTSYDIIPYPSYSYAQTYPDHLATLAILSGLEPPPVEHCRVLELGCAAGGNLLPMAYSLPRSRFTGIDLAGQAIAGGQQAVAELGLENVRLFHKNIMDVGAEWGQFDYILAYGIYSWVAPPVQRKLLNIVRQQLAPQGVAYISYNVYPGWRLHAIIRDALFYHTRHLDDPQARLEQGWAWLEFLAEATPQDDSLYTTFLQQVQKFLLSRPKAYLFHDFMEEVNEPLYFHQFIERARQQGLQYLANAEFATPGQVEPAITEKLLEMTENMVEVEQYLDFLTNRGFRETLLCHREAPISRAMKPEYLARLRVASYVEPVNPGLDIHAPATEEFRAADGAALTTAHPLTKAALLYLGETWPQAIPYPALLASAQARLQREGPVSAADSRILSTNLLAAYGHSISLVSLHTHQPHFVTEASPRPQASRMARYQLQADSPVTNMYHRRVNLDQVTQYLLPYLDGSHDRAALLDIMLELEAEGILEVKQDEQPVIEPGLVRELLSQELALQLQQLGRAALLVG